MSPAPSRGGLLSDVPCRVVDANLVLALVSLSNAVRADLRGISSVCILVYGIPGRIAFFDGSNLTIFVNDTLLGIKARVAHDDIDGNHGDILTLVVSLLRSHLFCMLQRDFMPLATQPVPKGPSEALAQKRVVWLSEAYACSARHFAQ